MSGQAVIIANNAGVGAGTAQTWLGGQCVMTGKATWGGGNIVLQQMDAFGNWVPVSGGTLSADGCTALLSVPSGQIRVFVTTATAVYSSLVRIT